MFLRILVVFFWIFTLLQPASAQSWRRRKASQAQAQPGGVDKVQAGAPASEPAGANDGAKRSWRRTEAHGWVWVSRTIDLAQQLGGEDNIPTLDGLRLFEIMIQKGIDTPAIFVTGSASPETEARSLEIGAADFLRKPIRKEALLPRIRTILQRRERARENS